MSDAPIPFPPAPITVRYVPHAEAPGRPVRIDYGTIAHEYITREDARQINEQSLLSLRCQEATGIYPEWGHEVREGYSQLAAVLGALDAPAPSFPGYDPGLSPQGRFPCVHVAVGPEAVKEVVSEADFDLFPIRDQEMDDRPVLDLTGKVPPCPRVVTSAKVSDDDGGRPCPPEHETTIDFEDPVSDLVMDLRAPESDPVHSPSHYTDGGIETIDYLEAKLTRAEFVGFCRGNALKYLSRAGKKGPAAEDFAKAAWYCARAEKASR